MTEVIGNSIVEPTTVLNGAINNSVLSLDVIDASELPVGGSFRILIWDGTTDASKEIIKVASFATLTLTLSQRGAEGTTAQSHADGDPVELVLTEEGLNAFITQEIQDALALFFYYTAR